MASPSYTSTARLTCHLCEALRAEYYAAWGDLSAFQTRKLNGDDSDRWRYMELRRAMQDAARCLGEHLSACAVARLQHLNEPDDPGFYD